MQAFWNEKFQTPNLIYGEAPNNFIKKNVELLLHVKTVMCLGEGEGRNAIYLADRGLNVEALDISDTALFKLRKRAKEHYVSIKTRHTRIEYWQPEQDYDAVICTYLQLPKQQQKILFEKSLTALSPNGYFIAELFSESQVHFQSGGPKKSDFLYDVNDIVDCIKKLPYKILKLSQEVVVLDEGDCHQGKASVVRIILQKCSTTEN